MVVGRGASGELRGAGHMLSLRLLADSDRVCYRNCCALSNIHLFAPMQTYVKDMSISPLFVCLCCRRYSFFCPVRPSILRVSVDCITVTATLRRTGVACTTSGSMTVIQSANSRPIATIFSGRTSYTYTALTKGRFLKGTHHDTYSRSWPGESGPIDQGNH